MKKQPKVPSENPGLKHNQSAELVDEVRRQADAVHQGKKESSRKPDKPKHVTQPVHLGPLGKRIRETDKDVYTQDNEEEPPKA